MKETICDFIKCYNMWLSCQQGMHCKSCVWKLYVLWTGEQLPTLVGFDNAFLYLRDMASKNVHNRKCGLQFLADITSLIINELNIKIQWNMNCQFVSTHSKAGPQLHIKKNLDEINLSPLNNRIFHMVLELFWLWLS